VAADPVSRYLDDNVDLKLLQSQLDHIKRLQRRYRTLAPERLLESSRVCAIDGTTVVICAASGPVAAVLRQLAPRLLEGLRTSKHSRDQELTSIRIEVQVERRAPRRSFAPRGELPREKLARVAASLGDSPLKDTLQRLSGATPTRKK
jgi:Dna[CI] antecedent DciA-like protein